MMAAVLEGVRWHVDAGHAWLRVPVVSGEGLRFSTYSYVDPRAGWLYLEEDCDAGVWLRAHRVTGVEIPTEFVDGLSSIRNLPRLPKRLLESDGAA